MLRRHDRHSQSALLADMNSEMLYSDHIYDRNWSRRTAIAVRTNILPRFVREMHLHPPSQVDPESVLRFRKLVVTELWKTDRPESQVAFTLPRPTAEWFRKNWDDDMRFGQRFEERIVLTSSIPGQIQATTVRQYLELAWPCGSGFILRLFQHLRAVFSRVSRRQSTMMPSLKGDPLTRVTRSGSNLVVSFMGGYPLSVAELAEQLAWLSATTQDPLSSAVEEPTSVPLKAEESHNGWPYSSHQHWDLHLDHRPFDAADPCVSLLHQLQCHGTLLKFAPPIIGGFPTARRPDNEPGVEVPSHVLLDMVAPQEELRVDGSGVFLCGKDLTLRLIKKTDHVLVWHVLSSVPPCACQLHFHPARIENGDSGLAFDKLKNFRHIVGFCHTVSASPDDNNSATKIETTESRLGGELRVGSKPEDGPPLSMVPRRNSLECRLDFPEEDSHSSWESSLETDEISSELSEDELIGVGGPDEALSPFADAVARRLLEEHRRATACLQTNEPIIRVLSPGTPGRTSQNTHESSLQVPHGPDEHRPRSSRKGKGRATRDQDQDSGDEESQRRQPKKKRLNDYPPEGVPKQLACHFWKLDPRKHRSCFRFTLEDTSRVKQHLKRKHTPEYYCERCWAVFPDDGTHQTHVKVEVVTCPSRTCNFPEITYRQREALRIRSTSNTEESRWFDMWDIIFPNSPRPPSPYIDSDLSEELCELMEFVPAHGPAIIAAEIQASIQAGDGDLGIPEGKLAGFLQRVITPRCLTLIFETWLARRPATASPQPGVAAHSTTGTSSHSPPSESSRDQSTSNPNPSTHQETPESSVSRPDSGARMPDLARQGEQVVLPLPHQPQDELSNDHPHTQHTRQEEQDALIAHRQPHQAVASYDCWLPGDGFGQQEDIGQQEWVGQQSKFGQEQGFVDGNWERLELAFFDHSTGRASGGLDAMVLDWETNFDVMGDEEGFNIASGDLQRPEERKRLTDTEGDGQGQSESGVTAEALPLRKEG